MDMDSVGGTVVLEDSSELEEGNYYKMDDDSILINVEESDCWYQNGNGSDDVLLVAMATSKKRNDDECLFIGESNPRRKRKRFTKFGNSDCAITNVSHDPSHDQDILYVSTDTKRNMQLPSGKTSSISTPPLNGESSTTPTTSVTTPSNTLATPTTSTSLITPSNSVTTPALSSLISATIPSPITCFLGLQRKSLRVVKRGGRGKRKKQQKSRVSLPDLSSNTTSCPDSVGEVITGHSISPNDREASEFISSSSASLASSLELPSWWISSQQSSLSSLSTAKFSLVDLESEAFEGKVVTTPINSSGLKVLLIQRIQSPSLWRRYMGEVRLLLEERGKDFSLNEKLLYHCSCASKDVICVEGLDVRLSRNGNFGRGIYFSDQPRKCDCYYHERAPCKMFACKVILGDTKVYATGDVDQSLTREPQRSDGSYYDSVLGYVSIGGEYVIYNNYRAVPLYYMEYTRTHRGR